MQQQALDHTSFIRDLCRQEGASNQAINALCAALDSDAPLEAKFEGFAKPLSRHFPAPKKSTALLACYIARVNRLAPAVLPGNTPIPDLERYASLHPAFKLVLDALIEGGACALGLRASFPIVMKLRGRVKGTKNHQRILDAIASIPGTTSTGRIVMGSGMNLEAAALSLLVHHALDSVPRKKSPSIGDKRVREVFAAYTKVVRSLPSVMAMEREPEEKELVAKMYEVDEVLELFVADDGLALDRPTPRDDDLRPSKIMRTENHHTSNEPRASHSYDAICAQAEMNITRHGYFPEFSFWTLQNVQENGRDTDNFAETMPEPQPELEAKQPEEQDFFCGITLEDLAALEDDYDPNFLDLELPQSCCPEQLDSSSFGCYTEADDEL